MALEWDLVWPQKTSCEVGQPCENFIKFSLITRLAASGWGGVGWGCRDSARSIHFIELCVVFITSREVGDTFDTHDVRTGLGISQSSEGE